MSYVPYNVSKDALLSYLRPLHDIGIFPLPLGWKIVCSIAAFLLLAFVCRFFSTPSRRRRRIFAAFKEICKTWEKNGDVSVLCADLSVFMRRVTRTLFKNENAAAFSDEEWIAFLNDTGARLSKKSVWFLTCQAYAPAPKDPVRKKEVEELIAQVRLWLRRVL